MKAKSDGKGNDTRIVRRHTVTVSVTKNATTKRNGLRNRNTFHVAIILNFGHLVLFRISNFVLRILLLDVFIYRSVQPVKSVHEDRVDIINRIGDAAAHE